MTPTKGQIIGEINRLKEMLGIPKMKGAYMVGSKYDQMVKAIERIETMVTNL